MRPLPPLLGLLVSTNPWWGDAFLPSVKRKKFSGSQLFESSRKHDVEDNKAMKFLKTIGKVGGTANRDFRFALGVDEGPSGKSAGSGNVRPLCIDFLRQQELLIALAVKLQGLSKSREAFKSCVDSGVVDDMSEGFPTTSSGSRWSGFT